MTALTCVYENSPESECDSILKHLFLFIIGIINVNAPIACVANIGALMAFLQYHKKLESVDIMGTYIFVFACLCLLALNVLIQVKSSSISYLKRFLIILSGMVIGTLLLYVTKGLNLYSPIFFNLMKNSIPYFILISLLVTVIILVVFKTIEKSALKFGKEP